MVKAKIIGACGYGGVGISELLHGHPGAEIGALVDVENTGAKLSDLYPHLSGHIDNVVVAPDSPEAVAPADVVFMATPDRVGMKLASAELDKGARIIDYSGDFRFNDAAAYAEYASRIDLETEHAAPELLPQAVYGIPELHRSEVTADTRIVGNPGCFAVSCIVGLAPAVKDGLLAPNSIICDCKTGVSGAGRKPHAVFHYPARYDMMNAYKLAGHQHVCEIERELGLLAGEDVIVTFTAQVVPVCRGIMSTLYGTLAHDATEEDLLAVYRDFYEGERFVQVFPSTAPIGSMHVRGTNGVKLVISVDARTRRMRVVSYIDNLVKGQAGSALQNMNLLFGLEETAGLDRPGIYP
ncbi:MAG: N-acetyl-gamma-glutamyl-phosphate reductase [Kiritimatiellia bacterium]|jgi:N-acetyl-gamma-glutamyl-phosphate reductase|nr:N-acetyl-gamma-glutamyl-phosphate reductase [Kiritimatiellia bacterium]MDP6630935.1 N-acetyl-gamma-glutamyl-phosphate reductase [Kiritimatiellia bacterium]MDP6810316.1 N-acetyl-gamma-glutamyl-phosphate reductase [Kiritimatiellia bacterium]MDP7022695.1 N-acetyl-gamma-glutamyl-phosphate reductase [Kiritimatiellia bacterium]